MGTRHVPVDKPLFFDRYCSNTQWPPFFVSHQSGTQWPPFVKVQYPMTPFFECLVPKKGKYFQNLFKLFTSVTIQSILQCPISVVICYSVPDDPLFFYYSSTSTEWPSIWWVNTRWPPFLHKDIFSTDSPFATLVATYPSLFKWVPPPPGLGVSSQSSHGLQLKIRAWSAGQRSPWDWVILLLIVDIK